VTDLAVAHDDLRPLMFSIAYRMLGSVVEAEDVVQDAFVRMHRASAAGTVIDSPDAYATTVTTRLAIDALGSARLRREQYVGPWLPEPLVADRGPDPAARVELDDSVSVAMLVLMERLTPVERAVFILRETLGYEYAEIAAVVERSEVSCRQLLTRARKRLEAGLPRFDPPSERRDQLVAAFLLAVRDGATEDLERLLAEDVVFYGDGGGRAPAFPAPLHGVTRVARTLLGLGRRSERSGLRLEPTLVNGQPGVLATGSDGALLTVLSLEIVDGRITALRNQLNPDKLGHLGRVGNLDEALRG
jgi:RNA polymerase sigma-70 factor (TIGR02957 family)